MKTWKKTLDWSFHWKNKKEEDWILGKNRKKEKEKKKTSGVVPKGSKSPSHWSNSHLYQVITTHKHLYQRIPTHAYMKPSDPLQAYDLNMTNKQHFRKLYKKSHEIDINEATHPFVIPHILASKVWNWNITAISHSSKFILQSFGSSPERRRLRVYNRAKASLK